MGEESAVRGLAGDEGAAALDGAAGAVLASGLPCTLDGSAALADGLAVAVAPVSDAWLAGGIALVASEPVRGVEHASTQAEAINPIRRSQ